MSRSCIVRQKRSVHHPTARHGVCRRELLAALIAGGLALVAGRFAANRKPKASVFLATGQSYDGRLTRTIDEALRELGWTPAQFRGKRVLVKPNLVEPSPEAPHITTHPALVAAAVEYFRAAGASVLIGEAPGHVRDTEMALEISGIGDVVRQERVPFADLNYAATVWLKNRTRASRLAGFYVPEEVAGADVVVSMPKLKTHHWVGMTASMKNFYGILPGIRYGWPKNVLHYAGIPQTVFDIASAVPAKLAIVDAIQCMEGDGPIMGTAKPLGAVLVGWELAAVDATAARLMGLRAERIPYLTIARRYGHPVDDRHISQRGARWQEIASRFELPDYPHLRHLRPEPPQDDSRKQRSFARSRCDGRQL
ncbi:MAG: hypothetical protein KatS3mg110_2123 [Pirellulaceae bacterium]|nr:MAG: hypothetical protein KatS3mg110_2123 [Pirellulaceae bacterium]